MITPVDILVFACLAGFLVTGILVVQRSMATVEHQPSLESWQVGNSDSTISGSFDTWLSQRLRQAGFRGSTVIFVLLNVSVALFVAGMMWINEVTEVLVVLTAVLIVVLGILTVQVLARRRQKKFGDHFPSAIELLARSVRAGESLEQSLDLTSRVCQEPVKQELGFCSRQLKMGLGVPHVMKSLSHRMPTMDVRIFAHTITVHRETGGRLSNTLDRLAKVIRQRTDYLQKIRTMTSLGRFAAITIGYMGVFVLAYLLIFHPEYIGKLWDSPLGRKLATYAAISEIVGIGWVALTLSSSDS